MSIGPNVPLAAPTAIADDHNDRDILESLSGLSIKGFQDCLPTSIMHTPSSTNTSLPTPPALKSSIVILVTPSPSRSVYPPGMDSMDIADSTQSAGDDWCPLKSTLQTPGVPLLKDLDSFTNGTGHSSFNFLDPVGANTGMLFYHSMEESSPAHECDHQDAQMNGDDSSPSIPSNSLALDLLPSPANLEEFVQAWREKIEPSPPPQDTPVAKKRRRSLTLDSSCADEHRPRVWSPTTEFSHTARPDMREAYSLAGCTDHAPPD